jgi:cytochrome c biogenesis protein CcdA
MIGWHESGLSLAAGGLTALSPCVFPLLPLVLGGPAQRHRAAPLVMALGMTLSFAVLGVLIGLFGAALGLIWSPCSGRLLGSALSLVASEGGAARGALILGLFGAGAAWPICRAPVFSACNPGGWTTQTRARKSLASFCC